MCDDDKKWIVDVDSNEEICNTYIDIINRIRPSTQYKIICKLKTKNGFHIITRPFDIKEFTENRIGMGLTPVDIHKDNPTILYCI
jgi:hypothetical protein